MTSPTIYRPPTAPRGRVSDHEYDLILDDFLADTPTELLWPLNIQTYAAMRRDPSVAAILAGYGLQLRRASWQLDGRDVDPAHVRLISDDMDLPVAGQEPHGAARTRGVSWSEHLRVAVNAALTFGHMGFALGAEVVDGLARLNVLAERPPQTITDIHADPVTGAFLGITQDRRRRDGAPQILARDMVWYCHEREAGANWAGVSLLRPAWSVWMFKREMLRVHATSNRRWGAGVPVMEALPGSNPSPEQMREAALMASAARAGEQAGAAAPPNFTMKILGLSGGVPDTLAFIEWLDRQVSRAVLMQHLELGQGTSGGARALGTAFIDSWMLSLETLAEATADTATRQIAAPISGWNWVDAPVPRVTVSGIGSRREVTAESLNLLLNSGALSTDPALEAWVRREFRLPEREGMAQPAPSVAGDTVTAANRKPRARASKRKEPAPGQLALPMAAVNGEPDYAALQTEWEQAKNDLLEEWPAAAEDAVSALAAAAAAAVVAGTLADLGALAVAPALVSAAAVTVVAGMTGLAVAAAGHAAREVAGLGQTVDVPDQDGDRLTDLAEAFTGQILAGYAGAAGRKALTLAGADATADDVEAAVREHLDAMSTAPTGLVADGVGGALSAAQNTGRGSVFAQTIDLIFLAAEDNDSGSRCDACTAIDQTEFATWAEAVEAYPTSGYRSCAGMHRCRGTVRAQLPTRHRA